MKNCKYCMSEIHEKAVVCPVCRKRLNTKEVIAKIDRKIELILFVILGILIICAIINFVFMNRGV